MLNVDKSVSTKWECRDCHMEFEIKRPRVIVPTENRQTLSFEEALSEVAASAIELFEAENGNNGDEPYSASVLKDAMERYRTAQKSIGSIRQRELAEARKEVAAASEYCVSCGGPMLQHGWGPEQGVVHPLPKKDLIAEARRETWSAAQELSAGRTDWRTVSEDYRDGYLDGVNDYVKAIHTAAEEFERRASAKENE